MIQNMMDVIGDNKWTVSMETEEGRKYYPIKGYAQAFDDASEYVITRGKKQPDGKYTWYVSTFGMDNHAKLFISGIPVMITGSTIHEVVTKFNRMYESDNMIRISPIHKVSIPETLFTLYYNEDGEWDMKPFTDGLSELHTLLTILDWTIPTKSIGTSRYRIIGIASTETDESICLLSDNSENDHHISVTPIVVATDGTYMCNYYTTIVSSGGLGKVITQLNRMIATSGNINVSQITDVITKNGDRLSFSPFERS